MADHLSGLSALEDFFKQVVFLCSFETLIQLIKQNVQELSCVLLYTFLYGWYKGFEQLLRNVILSFRVVKMSEQVLQLLNKRSLAVGLHDEVSEWGDGV
jgi:hypothetical protein